MQARTRWLPVASFAAMALSAILAAAAYLPASLAPNAALIATSDARSLWQPVRLKSEEDSPRSFSASEKRRIEDAIRAQIRAYAAGDAEQAFARLAPSTQRFFGKPDKFLRSIAQEIPAVLDAKRFAFLGVEQVGKRIVQQVLITDSAGHEWLAEFQLERQGNRDWRIKACVVQSTPGQQA